MIDFETVLIERDGAVATVTMNRPESMNAFNSCLETRAARGRSGAES